MPINSENLQLTLAEDDDVFNPDVYLNDNFTKIDEYISKTPVVHEFSATEGQTIFNLSDSYIVGGGQVKVEIDNVPQSVFIESSSTSITLTEGVPNGANVRVTLFQNVPAFSRKLMDVETQLADIANLLNKQDVFTTVNGTKCLDGTKVSTILNATENKFKTYTLPPGTYMLVNPITINLGTEVSLQLDDNTTIKAYDVMDAMFIYSGSGNTKRKVIKGGRWDGDGKATTCINIQQSTNVIFRDIQISNPITYGMKVDAGYELIVHDILFLNSITTNIEGNTALYVNTFDAEFHDLTIVNYTIGMEVKKNANHFTNVHIWGNQITRTASSIGLIDRSGMNSYDKVYFDTCLTSVLVYGTSHFKNCMFGYADTFKITGITPVYISNQGGVTVFFDGCDFLYVQQNGSTNTAQVSTGSIDLIQYINCTFTSTTLTNVPKNNIPNKVYKFRVNFTGFTSLPANGGAANFQMDLTLAPFYFNNLVYDDTVIFNGGLPTWGVIPQYYTSNNVVGVRLTNVTTAPITPANMTVYVTIIKNYDKTVLPYIS